MFGMIHDIGRLIMSINIPNRNKDVHLTEAKELGFDHAQLGGALLRKWDLPEACQEAVEFHHNPSNALLFRPIAIWRISLQIRLKWVAVAKVRLFLNLISRLGPWRALLKISVCRSSRMKLRKFLKKQPVFYYLTNPTGRLRLNNLLYSNIADYRRTCC